MQALRLEGLDRVRAADVRRELRVEAGDVVTLEEIEEGVQRVRNTNLFSSVEWSLDEGVLVVVLTERWTLLPIATFKRGGGVLNIVLGAYDLNFLRRRLEVGGRYELLGRTHSGEIWMRDPRLFGGPLDVRAELGLRNRLRILYDDDAEVDGGFLVQRFFARGIIDREWTPVARTRLVLGFEQDWYSLSYLPDDARAIQEARGLPPDAFLPRVGIGARLGRIDVDDFRLSGGTVDQLLLLALEGWGADANYLESVTEVVGWLPVWRLWIGGRGLLRLTSGAPAADQTFLGGLDSVRGFPDSRFRGAHGWLANVEVRFPLYAGDWIVLQHATFFDAVGVADRIPDLAVVSGASVGTGLRLLSPRLYGLVVRVDLALAVYGGSGVDLNIGGSQFF